MRGSGHAATVLLAATVLSVSTMLLTSTVLLASTRSSASSPAAEATPEIEERQVVEGPAPPPVGSSTSLLTREELAPFLLLSVAEAIELAAGVRLDGGASRAGTNAASIRGGDPNQVLVLLDGVVLNDPTGPEGGAVNLASLGLEEIESIEIVRGPASARHGGRALAGLIHVRTRDGARGRGGARSQGGARGSLRAEAGSLRFLHAAVAVAGGTGEDERGSGRLELSRQTESGRQPGDSFQQSQAVGRWSQALGERSRLELSGRAARRRALDHPEGSGGPELGDGQLRRTLRKELSLGLALAGSAGEAWRHEASLVLADQVEDFDSPAIGFVVPASEGRTEFRRLDAGWTLSRPLGRRLGLALGLGVADERARQRGLLDFGFPVPSDYLLERLTKTGSVSLHRASARTSFELAARVDAPRGSDAEWSAQAGLTRTLGAGRTRLALSFAEGFQQPSAFALAAPPELGGNPDLRPERSRMLEAGLETASIGGRLGATARAWVGRYRDLVDFDFDLFTHLNRGLVEAWGVELSGHWSPRRAGAEVHPGAEVRPGAKVQGTSSRRWMLSGRLAFQEVEDRDAKEPLPRRPSLTGGVDLVLRPRENLSLSLDLRGRTSFLDEAVTVEGPQRVPGGLGLGAALRWQALERLELSARLDDLLDTAPAPRLGHPAPGRRLRVALSLTWP